MDLPIEVTRRQSEIIIEAARLFREKGYLATSIRDISEALEMTSAALYYHFKNKEEILLGIMNVGLDGLLEAVGVAIANESTVWEKIRAALEVHLEISLAYQDFAFVLLKDLRHLSPEWQGAIIEKRDRYDGLWDKMLSEGQAAGIFRSNVDLELLRLMTFGAVNLVISWYKPSGTYRPQEIADAFLNFIGEGVLTPEASTANQKEGKV